MLVNVIKLTNVLERLANVPVSLANVFENLDFAVEILSMSSKD